MIFLPLAVESLLGDVGTAFSVFLGVMVVLPILTSMLMLADGVRQRRRHLELLSMGPVVLAIVGAVVMLWSVLYAVALPKEEGVAFGLAIPWLLVPPMLLTASLVHWSDSRRLDATPHRE